MQSEIFQAFICYNFDDKIITNKGLKYLNI